MKISVIIVTYNAMKWAEKCFSSLRKSSIPIQTIVVDNGSTDGTQNYIQHNFPEVEFVQSEKNVGFGIANNKGIEIAYKKGADFFYLMNQDAWIFENSFEKLLEVYENYPNKNEIGVLSPMHLDGSEKKLDLHFERYLARYTEYNRLVSDLFIDKTKSFYEINFINAAHWLIPKQTIEEIGGFNPYFFHGAEDYDYVNRLKYFDKKIILCPHSTVVHDAIQDFKKKRAQNREKSRRKSLRMQRETKYMDPSYDFNIITEKKEFYSNIIKLALKGNFSESKFYLDTYRFFSKQFPEIMKLREIARNEKHAFLDI